MHSWTIDIVYASRMILAVWTQGRFCIRETLVFANQVDHVHTVPTSATLKPETHHIMYRSPNIRVFPVEIRLFRCEEGEEVLACGGVVGPLEDFRVSISSLGWYSIK